MFTCIGQGHNVTTIGEEELPHNVSSLVSKGNPIKWIADSAFNESQHTLQVRNTIDITFLSL